MVVSEVQAQSNKAKSIVGKRLFPKRNMGYPPKIDST
jgi:hypothetical protein